MSHVPVTLEDATKEIERLRRAIKYVVDKFKKDEAQGYHTKDREFAITILDKALALTQADGGAAT